MGFLAAIAAGYGGGHLGLTLWGQNAPEQTRLAPVSTTLILPQTAPKEDQPWPTAFGQYVPDPQTPEVTEPTEPVVNYAYVLKGLFANAADSWAIVQDSTGDYLLRIGDELPGGAIVSNITADGVFLDTAQGPELIAFDE